MTGSDIAELAVRIEEILADRGVQDALGWLNARTDHRFTGVYRLDPPLLRSVRLFDRENPLLEVGSDAPMSETYCSITGAGESPFVVADALEDPALEGHPARDATRSYCGVPLRDRSGRVIGTLCHFDLGPRPVPEAEIPVMETAAALLYAALRHSGALPDPADGAPGPQGDGEQR
jgi:GAF domain-containing protein